MGCVKPFFPGENKFNTVTHVIVHLLLSNIFRVRDSFLHKVTPVVPVTDMVYIY